MTTMTTTAAAQRRAKAASKDMALRLKQAKRAAGMFKHVSDPTRLQVVLLLVGGEMSVGEMCDAMGLTQPAVSHHLMGLRLGGVVETRRDGKRIIYSLTDIGRALNRSAESIIGK